MANVVLITVVTLARGITAMGDSAVMLPCIGLIAIWLAMRRATRDLAWRWLALAIAVMSIVGLTKLAFMGWLVSIPGCDFTGLSGHAATSSVVLPAMLSMLLGQFGLRVRAAGALVGLVMAVVVAWSRLVLNAHSLSEVVLGGAVGGSASLAFLWYYRERWYLPDRAYLAPLSLLLVLPFVYGDQFPSENLLQHTAQALSGHRPYTRQDLHRRLER